MENDSLGAYLKDCGRIRLLTADEEITLGHLVQKMIHIQETVPEAERTRAHKRAIKRGERAKRKMVECNLRLVVAVAKKYQHIANKITLEDLIQEGNLGLIRAVEKFDPSRGYKFSTYSFWWIRQAVGRAIGVQDRLIRLPLNAMGVLKNARSYILEYYNEHGTRPTVEQIAKHTDSTVNAVEGYLMHINDAKSLDMIASQKINTDSTLVDLIADPESLDDLEIGMDQDDLDTLYGILDNLPERHSYIIKARFGLIDGTEHTLKQVGDKFGVSRERIRQEEIRAMRRLRMTLNRDQTLGKICA